MSRPSLLGRGILRRSSISMLTVATLLAGTMMIERILQSRLTVINLDSEQLASGKISLGLNAIGGPSLPVPEASEKLLRIPIVEDLPYRQQSVLGLFVLGFIGFIASIRPFDPERPMLESVAQPLERSES